MTIIGKRVVDELYVHLSAIEELADAQHRQLVKSAVERMPAYADPQPCVAKINLKSGRVSLLAYPDFEDDPFPELAASWVFAAGSTGAPQYRTYADSLNPPILHRKELLVPPSHPQHSAWTRLTETAEALGLFDDTATIGFKFNWQRLIASKGYQLVGDGFQPLGNDVCSVTGEPAPLSGPVQRHLTALSRSSLSAPVQLLFRHGLISPGVTVFDYGCGRGGDVAGLRDEGYVADGWDPHYARDNAILSADVVNLGFVVNVIEDAVERVEALRNAFGLARQVLSIGVMLYGNEIAGRPFRDGFLTSRNTFQKYFTQAEFKDYIEQILHREAFMVGPGVAFVFANDDAEQRFAAGRYRTRGVAHRLLATRTPRVRLPKAPREQVIKPPRERVAKPPREPRPPTPPKISRAQAEFERLKPWLDQVWTAALDLGRMPEPDEFSDLAKIEAEGGSYDKACKLVLRHYDRTLLATAAQLRADDVRLFLATQQFSKRPAYRQLEPRLQRDIKAFFGDYRTAQSESLRLLRDAADPAKLLQACQQAATAGIGWLENEHSLRVHVSLVERLPALLRAYVACGLILWDSLSDVQLVKIHISSGKLTLLEFDDFDSNPIPLLRRRIKVNVRHQDYDIFEYGSREYPKPLLYHKSRYLNEDYPGYAEQLAFDEALEATGLIEDSDYGPPMKDIVKALELRRLGVKGLRIAPSENIPDLDQPCGANFTFRSFIECGETQQRLGLVNVPINPATYNALHALAVQILDPLIEYYGAIRLTYGFCSAALSKQIAGRIAPKLDQHASHECGPKKTLICERGGAACDFLVEDEDMKEVADWIIDHLPFDRLYFYGSDRPIHVSFSEKPAGQAFCMVASSTGRMMPRPYRTGTA